MNLRMIPVLALAPLVLGLNGCIFVVDGDGRVHHALHVDRGHPDTIQGSGVSKTETRTVQDFHKIVVEGSADLSVKMGEPTSLDVTGDDNLVSFVTTEVREGTLVIGMQPGSYSSRVGLHVAVTVPRLDGLEIRGSSDADLSGLSGASFAAKILGSGDVTASGKVDRLEAGIAGSGDLHLDGLEAREAKVEVSGSGDVEVYATETLVVSVSGSGDVSYRGDPKVTKSVAGSGSVVPHRGR